MCGDDQQEKQIVSLLTERDSLKAEVERLKAALENIKRHMELTFDAPHMSAVWNMAKLALK